jgi:hypothetical protein
MSHPVDPSQSLGHAAWSPVAAPAGEDGATHVFWSCDACGAIVGFWRPGHGSEPTSTEDAPPADVGAYAGRVCGT